MTLPYCSGVGKLLIVDKGVVEPHHLSNLFYRGSMVGMRKVEAVKQQLKGKLYTRNVNMMMHIFKKALSDGCTSLALNPDVQLEALHDHVASSSGSSMVNYMRIGKV